MNKLIYIGIAGSFLRIKIGGFERQWGAKDITWQKTSEDRIVFTSMATGDDLFNGESFALQNLRLDATDPLYEELGSEFTDYGQFKSWAERSLGFSTATGGSVAGVAITQEAYDDLEQREKDKFDANGGIITKTAFNKNFGFDQDTVLEGDSPAGKITVQNIDQWKLSTLAYGVQWDTELPTTTMTRIGAMNMHRTLPVQSLMRRCLLLDDGTVNYYLSPTDSTKKEDGVTDALLDGTDGMVMVELPEHWRKFEDEGTKQRVLISTERITGFTRVPKSYVSAYEASLQRSTNKLASVVNATTDYRGGSNNSLWDLQDNSLLGMPVTGLSRTNFRTYARNRGGLNWNCYLHEVRKTIFWLYYIEYAQMNCQIPYDATLTSEGYKKGGLGKGVTDASSGDWSNYNGYNPFVVCGTTNVLGNESGVITYSPGGWPIEVDFEVNSYRGIENPYGHIWEWTDGVNVTDGDIYLADGLIMSDDNNIGYTKAGVTAKQTGYIKSLWQQNGEILPKVTDGASSSTYWCDYYYYNSGFRGVLAGGAAFGGAFAGFGCSSAVSAPSSSGAAFGSRLCFFFE